MSVNGANLVQGPAVLYIAAFGATEPLDSAVGSPPTSAWTDLGGTTDGVTLTWNREFSALTVDQILYTMATQPTGIDLQVKTNLAEATLQNLERILNGGTLTVSASYSSYEPEVQAGNFQPVYSALIVDGWAPGAAKRRRVIMRKVLAIDNIESAYKKDGMFVYPTSFRVHYVSNAITPFHIVDDTSA